MELEITDAAGKLCDAASNNDVDLLRRLIDNGVSPDCGDYDARTALHIAASEGNNKIVEWLTGAKANVNVKDRWGNTPLMDAVVHGHEVAARILFEAGSRMNVATASGMMCSAASTGDLALLRMLHESGCDVRVGDYDGRTPLHLAAAEGQVVAVSFLLAAYAEVSSRDRWGFTAIDDAIRAEHLSVAKLLVSAGSPPPSNGITLRPEAQVEYDRMDIAEIRRHAAEGEEMCIRRGRRMKLLGESLNRLVGQLHAMSADNARYSTLLCEMLAKTMPDALTDFNEYEEHIITPAVGSSFWRVSDEATRIESHLAKRSRAISTPTGLASGEVLPRTFNAFILKLHLVQEGLELLHKMFMRYAIPSDCGEAPFVTTEKLVYMIRAELVIAADEALANEIHNEAESSGLTFKAFIISQSFSRLLANRGFDGPPHTKCVQRAFMLLEHGFKLLDLNLDGQLSKNDLMRSHADGELTLPPKLLEVCSSARHDPKSHLLRDEFNVCIAHTVDCQGFISPDEEGPSHGDVEYNDDSGSETGHHGSSDSVDDESEKFVADAKLPPGWTAPKNGGCREYFRSCVR